MAFWMEEIQRIILEENRYENWEKQKPNAIYGLLRLPRFQCTWNSRLFLCGTSYPLRGWKLFFEDLMEEIKLVLLEKLEIELPKISVLIACLAFSVHHGSSVGKSNVLLRKLFSKPAAVNSYIDGRCPACSFREYWVWEAWVFSKEIFFCYFWPTNTPIHRIKPIFFSMTYLLHTKMLLDFIERIKLVRIGKAWLSKQNKVKTNGIFSLQEFQNSGKSVYFHCCWMPLYEQVA